MRIDVYLAEAGLVGSRTEAKKYISEGLVIIDGKIVTKPSLDISGLEDKITVIEPEQSFVGRGGLKLDGALTEFRISVEGKRCLDVGASSGGFTDCLLQNGASHVIAVDSGKDQLVESIRRDDRVTSIEGYNARYMKPSDFPYLAEVAVMDVSFISATYIIPALSECVVSGADFILLIKPQFEVGRENVGKGGIVKSRDARMRAIDKVVECAAQYGFMLISVMESPITGGDGNVEYLAHFLRC